MATETPYDVVGAIMAYEAGDLDDDDTIVLFQHLVDTGMAWSLQGSYGRAAAALLDAGYVTRPDADASDDSDLDAYAGDAFGRG